MKIFCTLALILVLVAPSFGQTANYPDFEIVESIPVETVLDNPNIRNTQAVWLTMINSAKKSLDIEQFYISNEKGEPLDVVIQAIVRAGERGVAVRVIADARMYKTYPETVDMLGKQKNIQVHTIDFGKLAGGVQHAKFFIVDDEQVFFGSQNFDWRALKHIHEIGVRIRNKEATAMYEDVFTLDWQLAQSNERSLISRYLHPTTYAVPLTVSGEGGDLVSFTPTMSPIGLIGDTTLWDETWIVDLIDHARTDVFCQMLTYSPVERRGGYYEVLDNALRRAAVRGVKVKMIVSDWSIGSPTIDYLKSLACLPNIEVKYSAIPDWSGGYVPFGRVEHCKFLVVDSMRCWIGTSNWEKSYFYSTRNVGVVVENPKITGTMRKIFLKSWDGPYTTLITPAAAYQARKHGEQ